MNLTNKIIILCVFTFFVAFFLPQSFVYENLYFSLGSFLAGNVYTMITAIFMHSSVVHLTVNMFLLLFVGNILEDLIGPRKFAVVFFFGGMATFLLSGLAYGPADLLVGCSGSIFTVMAVAFVLNPLAYRVSKPYKFIFGVKEVSAEQEEVKLDKFTFFLDLFIFSLAQITVMALYSPVSEDSVGNLGHFIGFLIGFLFGIMWSEKWREYAKSFGTVLIGGVIVMILLLYLYYSVSHVVNPNAETFIDLFLSAYSIRIFSSDEIKCNNACLEEGFDYGLTEDGFCSCKYNITHS